MSREKRSITLHGHRTSVALEAEFWQVIDRQATTEGQSLAGLIAQMDDERVLQQSDLGLAAYLRVQALKWVSVQATGGEGF